VTARSVWIAAATLLLAATGARAQDFYANHLQRGMTNYQRSNYAQAAADLRVAAFGLIESPPDYERALIYATLANWKLQRTDDARQLAEKIATAERIAPSYAKLELPPEVRVDIEATLPKLLRPDQLARVPAFARLAGQSAVPPPAPAPSAGNESAARAMAEQIVADDYTNAVAQTVLAILSGRHSDWAGVVEHYSVVRTRRRLNGEEMNTFIMGLVRIGRSADATGVEKTRGPQPFVARATPAPTAAPATPPTLADADRAYAEGKPLAARETYRRLAAMPNLPREVALGVARGLSQTAAFRESSAVYQKIYPLRAGEEQHMFYEAVNRYEMGDYAIARKLLVRALPALPKTRDVELYRNRIERAQ
jgi:hypothetical protein